MTSAESIRSRWLLGGAAVFAMAWAITRAAVQSITIDEGDTYNAFVFRRIYLWYAANNHILNSTLMYGFTKLLGLSQFTARLPALLGAALYIAAVYRLCRLLGASLWVQFTVFVCLVFNPFIFDHLVAARGYGLALAFLMWAIVYFAEQYVERTGRCGVRGVLDVRRACRWMQTFFRLGESGDDDRNSSMRLVPAPQWVRAAGSACVLPGAAVVAIVSGYALGTSLAPGELVYGAPSLRETFERSSHLRCSKARFDFFKPARISRWSESRAWVWLGYLLPAKNPAAHGMGAAAIFAVTAAIHWTAFRLFGLLLPKNRTAVYFFPLFMIVAGVWPPFRQLTGGGRYLRGSFIGALAFMAAYFLLCLRLTYFEEWYWDADVQKAYAVLSCLNRTHKVTTSPPLGPTGRRSTFTSLAQPTSMQEIDESSIRSDAGLREGSASPDAKTRRFSTESGHSPHLGALAKPYQPASPPPIWC